MMRWCGNCCGAPGGEDEAHPGRQGDAAHHAIYNRVGRVERFKHKDTVLFLGKAVLAALLVILLVQFIADQEVCSVDLPLENLPLGAQKILSRKNQLDSWRCPYDEDYDVSFTFDIVVLTEKTVENVTMFKVTMADKKPTRNRDKVPGDTVTEVCGTRCYLKSCECVEKMITSSSCYVDKYQYGLQLEPTYKEKVGKSVFGIYFVISAILIVIAILFYAIFRVSTYFWGGKREGHAVIV